MQRDSEPVRRVLEQMQRLGEPVLRAIEQMQRGDSELVRRLAEQVQVLQSEPVRRMVEDVGRNLATVYRMAEEAGKRLTPWLQVVDEAARRIGESWHQMAEAASSRQKQWDELWRRYRIAEEEAAPILTKYKWLITPSLPAPLVFEVVREGRKPGRRDKAINGLFIDYFAADDWQALSDMVESWGDRPLLRKRMRILRDCVRTLRAADCTGFNAAHVVLPTLIAQVDGLLTDYLVSKGVKWDTVFEDAGRGPRAKVGRKTQLRKHKNTPLRDALDKAACFLVLDIILQKAKHGEAPGIPFGLNRHKVMHGEKVTYGRKDYVVRAFLALDYLACLQ